eukprot:15478864-Alexandrium_andersonii.AAC.1
MAACSWTWQLHTAAQNHPRTRLCTVGWSSCCLAPLRVPDAVHEELLDSVAGLRPLAEQRPTAPATAYGSYASKSLLA